MTTSDQDRPTIAHWPDRNSKGGLNGIDPRLSLIGKTWYWNGVPVEPPIPKNSDLSFAIAKAIRYKISRD